MTKWEYHETELWRHGEDGYSIFHVFGCCAVENTVFVFTEGRKGDGSDSESPHDIRMKRSVDGGKSFAEDVCVLSSDDGCWSNAIPLYDDVSKKLFLFYSDNRKNEETSNFVIESDDLGKSWSKPLELTELLNASSALNFHLAGPGHGICLKKGPFSGRLLMPFWHRKGKSFPVDERGYCVSVLYSDDHGKNWQSTECFGRDFLANESRLCETENRIFWVIRTRGKELCFAESFDGGLHFESFRKAPLPPARCCDVGVISLCVGEAYSDTVLISRVSDPEKRRDMEILISTDGGRSFPDRFSLMSGDVMPGYSDLCLLPGDGAPIIGLLHCRENHVLFSRISLQTLTGGKLDHTSRSVWLK